MANSMLDGGNAEYVNMGGEVQEAVGWDREVNFMGFKMCSALVGISLLT